MKRHQRIRAKLGFAKGIQIGGWFQGRNTYLRIADTKDVGLGTISDYRLYRLAKAIVRHYEADKKGVK
jgi:hypothetical protein